MSGTAMTAANSKMQQEPSEFLTSTLPAIRMSNPPLKKPPIMGTVLPIAYFAARKEKPSYVAEVMPCTVKKTVNTVSEMPSTYLMMLFASALKFFSFISSLMFPTLSKTQMSTTSGKTIPETMRTIISLRNSTAGW